MGAHYASGNAHVAETSQGGVETPEGRVLHQNMKFSRDAALSRIPAPHLLKQEQLQLAGASFREQHFSWNPSPLQIPMSFTPCQTRCPSAQFSPKHLWKAFSKRRSSGDFASSSPWRTTSLPGGNFWTPATSVRKLTLASGHKGIRLRKEPCQGSRFNLCIPFWFSVKRCRP